MSELKPQEPNRILYFRMFSKNTFIPALLLLVLSTGVAAHHAMEVHYLVSKEAIVTQEGVVKNFSLMDPHSYLVVTVGQGDTSEDWILEGQSRVILTRSGWRFDLLKAGTSIKFAAFPARSGDTAGRIVYLEVNGEVYCSDRCDLFDDLFGMGIPEISALPAGSTATRRLAESF